MNPLTHRPAARTVRRVELRVAQAIHERPETTRRLLDDRDVPGPGGGVERRVDPLQRSDRVPELLDVHVRPGGYSTTVSCSRDQSARRNATRSDLSCAVRP